jgi:tetratricopeptide (TPR) repeat protein
VADATELSARGLALGASSSDRGLLLLVHAYAAAYRTQASVEGLSDMLDLLPRGSANWWLALSLLVYGAAAKDAHAEAAPYLALALSTDPNHELTGVHGQALHALTASMVLMGKSELGWRLVAHFEVRTPAEPDQVFGAFLKLSRCQLATNSPRDGEWLLEDALDWGRDSVDVMHEAGARAGYAVALFYLGNCCRVVGRYEEAEQVLTQSIRVSQTGTVLMKQYSELMLARVIACRGRVVEALSLLAPLERSRDANVAFGARAFTAEAHSRVGAFDTALTHARAARFAATSPYWTALQATMARCLLKCDQPSEAASISEHALAMPIAPSPEYHADLEVSLASARLRLGQREAANEALARAVGFTDAISRSMRDPVLRATFLENVDAHARARVLAEAISRGA